jgi:cell division protein FtsW (lipid II flippase)
MAASAWTPSGRVEAGDTLAHPAASVRLQRLVVHAPIEEGEIVGIGRVALGQFGGPSSAALEHIALRRVSGEPANWEIANVSTSRRLQLGRGDTARLAREIVLEPDDRVVFAGVSGPLTVSKSERQDWQLRVAAPATGETALYVLKPDGTLLLEAGVPEADAQCPSLGVLAGLKARVAAILPDVRKERSLRVGGNAYCDGKGNVAATSLPMPGLPPGAFRLTLRGADLVLSPGIRQSVAVVRDGRDDALTFDGAFIALVDESGGREFTAGRTRYRTQVVGAGDVEEGLPDKARTGDLVIIPDGKVHRFFDPPEGAADADVIPPPGCFRVEGSPMSDCVVRGDGWTAQWTRLGEGDPDPLGWGVMVLAGGSGLLAFVAGLCFVQLASGSARLRGSDVWRALGFGVAAGCFLLIFREGRGGHIAPPEMVAVLGLAWLGAGAAFLSRASVALRGVLYLVLCGFVALGAATQLHMASFADTTAFEAYWQNQATALAVMAPVLAGLSLVPDGVIGWFGKGWVRGLIVITGVVIMIVLNVALLVMGDETGLAGIQPGEINKPVVVGLLAWLGAELLERWRGRGDPAGRPLPWRLGCAVLLLGGLALLPVGNSDFSPTLIMVGLILIFLVIGAMAMAAGGLLRWLSNQSRLGRVSRIRALGQLARRPVSTVWVATLRNGVPIGLLAGAGLTLSVLLWLRLLAAMAGPAQASEAHWVAPGFVTTVIERIVSWQDLYLSPDATRNGPKLYRDLGKQVRTSRNVLAGASCGPRPDNDALVTGRGQGDAKGAKRVPPEADLLNTVPVLVDLRTQVCRLAGVSSGGPPAGLAKALEIPAVHDDFAGSYLIHALGVEAGIALATLQSALVLLLLGTGAALISGQYAWPFDRMLRRGVGCACVGMGLLMAMQSLLSWGNVYGALPVMGQPMTFISAGMSHILAIGVSLVAVIELALRLLAHRSVRMATVGPQVMGRQSEPNGAPS